MHIQILVHETKYVTHAAKQHLPEVRSLFNCLYVHLGMHEQHGGRDEETHRGRKNATIIKPQMFVHETKYVTVVFAMGGWGFLPRSSPYFS